MGANSSNEGHNRPSASRQSVSPRYNMASSALHEPTRQMSTSTPGNMIPPSQPSVARPLVRPVSSTQPLQSGATVATAQQSSARPVGLQVARPLVQQPTARLALQHAARPVQQPAAQRPAQQPVARPVQQPAAARPVQQLPAVRPVNQPAMNQPQQPQQTAAARQVQQLVARPAQQPVARPVQQPAAARPVQQLPAERPVNQPAMNQPQAAEVQPLLSMRINRPANNTGHQGRAQSAGPGRFNGRNNRGGQHTREHSEHRHQEQDFGDGAWSTHHRNNHGRGGHHRGNNHHRGANHHDNWSTPDNRNPQDSQPNNAGRRKRFEPKHMGFRLLDEISKLDSLEALMRMNNSKNALQELLQNEIPPDFHSLLMKILSNICLSSFNESKAQVLIEVCNSNYIPSLQHYLMNLPYNTESDKRQNRLYWSEPGVFWENLLVFCETIVVLSPSTAVQRCRALAEATAAACLDGLSARQGYAANADVTSRLRRLALQFTECEKKVEEEKKTRGDPRLYITQDESRPPPEDFRELPVLPTVNDLQGEMPYVRPNIVAGGYESVDHYLDIQFRLLREDCYGPLRDGIRQYKRDNSKRRFDNIRVHKEVLILEPYQSKSKVGILVQFENQGDEKNQKKKYRKINWAHSKRFMFGALLLLTNDNCRSFMLATVLDRDFKTLEQGLLPISISNCDAQSVMGLFGKKYLMIESEVYFEPYFHVLRALQDPQFPDHLAMKNYIVHVEPATNPPAYLSAATSYSVISNNEGLRPRHRFYPLMDVTWPKAEDMGLDASQYAAYKLALTHEFSVIQGPPGTGKTYLGVLVARTLLTNLTVKDACAMLVICYTNHALDQFLEAILDVTESVVRIGGQSRSTRLEQFNLNKVRCTRAERKSAVNNFFYEKRDEMVLSTKELYSLQKKLSVVNNGVVNFSFLRGYVAEVDRITPYGARGEDPVSAWLFEGVVELYGAAPAPDEEREIDLGQLDEDGRNELILDDEVDFSAEDVTVKNLFDLEDVNQNIRKWMGLLRNCRTADESYNLKAMIDYSRAKIRCFMEQRHRRYETHDIDITNKTHPARFNHQERWAIYFKWMKLIRRDLIPKIAKLQAKQHVSSDAYEEARLMLDRKLLKDTRVVGMTTTGAARLQKLIRSLAPPIVIVEEAAEVLESHIVVSLTKHCQHLILIGDHQQLRPSAAHYKLAKHYNMEISLFERMITNGLHSRRLGVQHRMRPTIASLIVPAIYPELQNHHSVENFPNVRGLTANLFFLTHDNPEDAIDDSSSRKNPYEADLTLGLANYIMQQGYNPEDVTILAAYSGQMFYMRKEREKYCYLKDVKITVVDNYQGEESKIILLSLVRSNSEGNIGFLGTANRVCVALSRAREGFYILGDMDKLKKATELWATISRRLEEHHGLGTSITLRCENHPEQVTEVQSVKDFMKVPEGGCMLKCDINLKCLHPCPLICHAYDRAHLKIVCPLKCERVICELGHVCPLLCTEACELCKVRVSKRLPCGHNQSVPCHRDPNDPKLKCQTMVEVTLPACGHKVTKPCFMEIQNVPCPEPCVFRLPCGHACVNNCHKNKDPDHLYYKCEKPCGNAKKDCTAGLEGGALGDHACAKKCYETCNHCNIEVMKKRTGCGHRERVECSVDVDAKPCRQNCKRMLPCGHHCKSKCYEPCGNCQQKVKKVLPSCRHEVEVLCKDDPQPKDCLARCQRTLTCGHKCKLSCNSPCDPARCKEIVPQSYRSPCGHRVNLPCNEFQKGELSEAILLSACRERCSAMLACDHPCAGTCGECRQGRLHVPCGQPCGRTLLCGHDCTEPCKEVCPPCRKPCEVRCEHTRCGQLCGEPCPPCKEKCMRVCPHGSCNRRCSDECSQPPCNEPCPKPLPCGHRCRGLCGEPCPDACQQCDPDNFPTDLLGDPYDEDAKLIQLQDCFAKHFLEVEDMDNLMNGDRETIMIRSCPFCRTQIINTNRYKNQVNSTFRKEINPIKIRVYGGKAEILKQRDDLYVKSEQMYEAYLATCKDHHLWCKGLKDISMELRNKKVKMSLLQVNMRAVGLEVLERLGDNYETWLKEAGGELRDEIKSLMNMLLVVVTARASKISAQQQRDMEREIQRMRATVQLARIMANPLFKTARETPRVRAAHHRAAGLVLSWEPFHADDAGNALKALQEAVCLSGIVTQEERTLIVRAMGLSQGHWYKCPNGHIYCIGECGGAMQTSRCPECGAAIGGASHRLLSDNALAPEMDGARHAAWSDVANNMANWRLDD